MSVVHVVAVITTKPGQREKVLEMFRANVPNVHAEAGCIEYVATIDTPDVGPAQTPYGPDSFAVIEKWESLDHLKAHAASAHMKDYAAKVQDLLVDRKIYVLSPV